MIRTYDYMISISCRYLHLTSELRFPYLVLYITSIRLVHGSRDYAFRFELLNTSRALS